MRLVLLSLCFALVATAGLAQGRPADPVLFSWRTVLAGCLDYFLTGQRSVFADWDIAFAGGGVCNGDPACEGPVMTFIPTGWAARAAATVHVPGGVGDRPPAGTCAPAIGVHDPGSAVFEVLADQVAGYLARGILLSHGTTTEGDPVYVGCAWDGRAMRLVLPRGAIASNRFALGYPDAGRAACAPVMG